MSDEARPEEETESERRRVPRFVPVLIGVILVLLAGLAIYTGLESREETLGTTAVNGSSARGMQSGPPGEPEAGASRVVHGESGGMIPEAGPMTAEDPSKVVITGGPGGVEHVVRLRARRGILFDIQPPDAMVYVNESLIGSASQFASADEVYEFAEQGKFDVRVSAPAYKDLRYEISADPTATDEVAVIRGTLEK